MSTLAIRAKDWSPQHPLFDQVAALDAAAIKHAWKRDQWEKLGAEQWLFVRGKEKLEAFALYQFSPWENLAHLLKIAVQPELQGAGVAQALWDEHLMLLRAHGMQKVFLEVASNNERAISFYRKLGFSVLREVRAFYQDGQNALTMELAI